MDAVHKNSASGTERFKSLIQTVRRHKMQEIYLQSAELSTYSLSQILTSRLILYRHTVTGSRYGVFGTGGERSRQFCAPSAKTNVRWHLLYQSTTHQLYRRVHKSPHSASPCSHTNTLLLPCTTPKLNDHPLSAVCNVLPNTPLATLCICNPSQHCDRDASTSYDFKSYVTKWRGASSVSIVTTI